jgi:hypothetical protein
MTVSHIYYDFGMIDASVSYEVVKEDPSAKVAYDVNNPMFQTLLQTVALGTKATFAYAPSELE